MVTSIVLGITSGRRGLEQSHSGEGKIITAKSDSAVRGVRGVLGGAPRWRAAHWGAGCACREINGVHPSGERPGGPRKPRAKRRGRGVTWYTTGRGRVASSSTARVASRGGCGFTEPCHGRHTTPANRADYRLSISYLRAATMREKEPFKFQRDVSDNVAPI